MQLLLTDAIVLKSQPFKESDKILTLYTEEMGLIKLYAKGKAWNQNVVTSPYTRAEYLCMRGRGDFFYLRDARLLNPYLHLRDSLQSLFHADKISQFLQHHSVENPNRELYLLLLSHMENFKGATSYEALFVSFLLKAQKAEGLLQLHSTCSRCGEPIENESFRLKGERFCKKDKAFGALLFSEQEEKEWALLLQAPSHEVASLHFDLALLSKIEKLFERRVTID